MTKEPVIGDPNNPLVSVLIFNYNYGCYLRQCFDSVFNQTYENYEICFSDNASTDDSWEIALEYARKYPGRITMTRNRKNFGPDANMANNFINTRGKYYLMLCSDDALHPEYFENCVNALEANPNAAFAIVHRGIINETGRVVEEPPFYNRTCLIPGVEQAAVYMMAAVNPSISQIVYRKDYTHEKGVNYGLAARWYSTRIFDFDICCEYPIIYIKEPLLLHRLHLSNDSYQAADNLMEVIGPYVLQHQFAETGAILGLTKVVERLGPSLEKLGRLCLRYCVRALLAEDERNAGRYFHLAMAIDPDVADDAIAVKLGEYWSSDPADKTRILKTLKGTDNLATRSVSYDPPPGSVPIEVMPRHFKVA